MSEAYQNVFPRRLINIPKYFGYIVGSIEPQRHMLQIIGVSLKNMYKNIMSVVINGC